MKINYSNNKSIKTPTQIAEITRLVIDITKQEHFLVFCLDTKNTIKRIEVVALGTVDQCSIHPRDVFRTAIECNATKIMLAHNHPSGNTEPSISDNKITKILTEAGELLGIKVLDHVIVTEKDYFSYNSTK